MTTLIVAFEKRAGMSTEELRTYYREEHAPLVAELPNLEEYEVTFPSDPARSPYDGLARMRFADSGAMREAMASETADEMEADAANFADPASLVQIVGERETFV